MCNRKTACVYKGSTGYWEVWADDTKHRLGDIYDTELDAYKAANYKGYIVR